MRKREEFLIKEVRKIHPKSGEYKPYWTTQLKKCIEGMWSSGYYMPGVLYFYVNFWHIKIKESQFSKTEVLAKPFLRDVEWIKAYLFLEAKGFSGFSEDNEVTCHRDVKSLVDRYPDLEITKTNLPDDIDALRLSDNCFRKDGSLKRYVHARDYLYLKHDVHKGYPLYENQAKNIIDLEARGTGKSYWAACLIGHNFIFDGTVTIEEYIANVSSSKPKSSETLVGSCVSSYSSDLLDKFMVGFSNLEGGIEAEVNYPAPFFKKTSGSLKVGERLTTRYKKKKGRAIVTVGTGSKLHHRTFNGNDLAGNGTRPNLTILEEVGFMGNLPEALAALKLCTMNGNSKFGIVYMFGTGGEMDPNVVNAVRSVYFNPEAFDCLVFDNERGGQRGFFVPYEMGLNEYKDEHGNTDLNKARVYIERERAKLKALPTKDLYNREVQNNPQTPEEIFLVEGVNIFPIVDLQEHLNKIEHNPNPVIQGHLGNIVYDATTITGVRFVKDIDGKASVAGFPVPKGEFAPGCVQIWELPPDNIPYGMYFAGTDPYDQDKAPNSTSLGSTFIFKKGDFREGGLNDIIVAEYTGRPAKAEDHHETVLRLLKLYNCETLYENEKNSMKFYFQRFQGLRFLARSSNILKATENSNVDRVYGTHMNKNIKEELEIYLRDWLLEDAGDGLKNYQRIYSVGLLKELINYNDTGNFDRVIAMLLVIYKRMMNHRIKVVEAKSVIVDPFFSEKIYN